MRIFMGDAKIRRYRQKNDNLITDGCNLFTDSLVRSVAGGAWMQIDFRYAANDERYAQYGGEVGMLPHFYNSRDLYGMAS